MPVGMVSRCRLLRCLNSANTDVDSYRERIPVHCLCLSAPLWKAIQPLPHQMGLHRFGRGF